MVVLNTSQLRARADLLRAAARKAPLPEISATLLNKATQLDLQADLLEHGADKPSQDRDPRGPRAKL
jgi:hypothetical protein